MDILENIDGSLIQHGPHNNRIYLMRFHTNNTDGLIATLDEMALNEGYGKVFAKIPAPEWNAFKSADYIKEAVIPGFFAGRIDGFFIAKYFSAAKQQAPNLEKLLHFAKHSGEETANNLYRTGRTTRDVVVCKPSDVAEMARRGLCRHAAELYGQEGSRAWN